MAIKNASGVGATGRGIQGMCCPHCADTKYPCVAMEKMMAVGKEKEPEPVGKRD